MLASTTKALPPGSGWVYELKLDGYRMIADLRDTEARLWSRGGHDYSARFKSVAEALPAAVAAPCVIDSEVCALDAQGHSSFSLLQAGQGTLAAFCFDLLELDGRDVTGLPLEERRELLSQVVTPGPVVRISHTYARRCGAPGRGSAPWPGGGHGQAIGLAVPTRQPHP